MINKKKSYFLIGHKTPISRVHIISEVTSFSKRTLPIKYLGCNIFVGRKKEYFGDLITKIGNRLVALKGRLLSRGGRFILIKHVLQSVLIYIFAAFSPPKEVIVRLEAIFSNSFWGKSADGGIYHELTGRSVVCLQMRVVLGLEDYLMYVLHLL